MKRNDLSRRKFLRTVVVSAGAASLGPSLLGCGGDARPTEEVFPQSVASGDPREGSIVLWTRALPVDPAMAASVRLELFEDEALSSRVELDVEELTASPDHDHCLRVKVTGLTSGSRYFYRFEHEGTVSNVGQFRTADPAAADIPVRFAVLSCQDYSGRYYNSLLRLLEEDVQLSFVVHLGDYIYETTGDPQFMRTAPDRVVSFENPDEAIALGEGEETYYAARSVSNYRDIYRTYRTDPLLQRMHERYPFICTWDDHEFSDDSHGATGTYSDGAEVEQDMERKLNAEQVWLEYMPVARDLDDGDGALSIDAATLYPNNRIYRSFRFGTTLTLAVTDYRSYRPDHPVEEDAYPGHVLLDQSQTQAALMQREADGEIPDAAAAFMEGGFRPYVSLEDATYADHQRALELLLTGGYMEAGVEAARAAELAARYAAGNVDAAVLNATIDAGRAALPADLMGVAAVDLMDPMLERGVSVAMMGKASLVSQLGARYLVVKAPYDLWHVWRTRVNGDTTYDDALGADQEAWLRQTVSEAETTWTVVANSVCSTSHVINLEAFADQLPPEIPAAEFYLNVDEWDGFPERRAKLVDEVYRPNNALVLAGDIHGAYVTDFGEDADGNRAIELTTSSVSSGSFAELLINTGNQVPAIRDSGLLEPLVSNIDGLLTVANMPRLKLSRSNVNGVLVVRLNEVEAAVDFYLLDGDVARPRNMGMPMLPPNYYDAPGELSDQWEDHLFRVTKSGGKNLEIIERTE